MGGSSTHCNCGATARSFYRSIRCVLRIILCNSIWLGVVGLSSTKKMIFLTASAVEWGYARCRLRASCEEWSEPLGDSRTVARIWGRYVEVPERLKWGASLTLHRAVGATGLHRGTPQKDACYDMSVPSIFGSFLLAMVMELYTSPKNQVFDFEVKINLQRDEQSP